MGLKIEPYMNPIIDSYYKNNAKKLHKMVDKILQKLHFIDVDKDEFYSGCYGRASVNFFAFNVGGNKGIACGLNNLQKLEDGERLGGSISSAEDDFGSTDDDLL